MHGVTLTQVLAAAIAAIPAIVAAWNSRQNKRNSRTSNGQNLATLVESISDWTKEHEARDEQRYDELQESIKKESGKRVKK